MNISSARMAAFTILTRIETEAAYSSVLLSHFGEDMEARDRGLMYELTFGVLRKRMYLDRIIDHFSSNKKLDLDVRMAIRLGLFQLLFLDRVPAHSAINESVNLVAAAKKRSAKGFVNAILRRSTRETASLKFEGEIEEASVMESIPLWLMQRWEKQFGRERAISLADAANIQPTLSFRLTRKAHETKFNVSAELGSVDVSDLVPDGFVANRNSPELRSAADDGLIYFQDEGSQLIAHSLRVSPEETFLDVCSAPGSKTTLVAIGHEGGIGRIVAGDINEKRLSFVNQSCERQGVRDVNPVIFDAESDLPLTPEAFDVVLVDAPCTGTGTLSHNPEIRYSLRPEDPELLKSKQLRILSSASKMVKKGGRLIYSTCSLETEENEAVIESFLAEKGERYSFEPLLPDVPVRFHTQQGFARTFPDRDGIDGFFIASLRRTQ